jgi:hypothetical protein
MWLADPLTHLPVTHVHFHEFPVLVVAGNQAWVEQVEDPLNVPPPPPGASYLVPPGKAREIEQYLIDHDTRGVDSSWVLNVKTLSPDRQRIELYLWGDGYWGGVYEATATTVAPQYRKATGPGFAFIFGPLALLMNMAFWGTVFLSWRLLRRKKVQPDPA